MKYLIKMSKLLKLNHTMIWAQLNQQIQNISVIFLKIWIYFKNTFTRWQCLFYTSADVGFGYPGFGVGYGYGGGYGYGYEGYGNGGKNIANSWFSFKMKNIHENRIHKMKIIHENRLHNLTHMHNSSPTDINHLNDKISTIVQNSV